MRSPPRNGSSALSAVRLGGQPGNLPLILTIVAVVGLPLVGLLVGGVKPAVVPLVAMAFTALFIARPAIALLVYLAARPLVDAFIYSNVSLLGGGASLGQAWGAGLLVLAVVYLARATSPYWRAHASWHNAYTLLPLGFVASYAAFTILRPGAHFAAVAGARLAAWILLAFVFERIARSAAGQQRTILAMHATAALLVVAVGIAIAQNRYGAAYYDQSLNSKFLIGHQQTPETLQAPFVYSSLAVLLVPFLLAPLLRRRPTRASLFLLALVAGCVVLSYVRATYGALAVAAVPGIVIALRYARKRTLLVGGALSLAGAAAAGVVLGSRIANRFSHGSGRLDLWRFALHNTIHGGNTLLVGGGAAFTRREWELHTGIPGGDWAHNDFVELFATGGPLLLALYLGVLAWMLHSIWGVWRDPRQTLAARRFGALALGALGAFVVMSFLSGIIFSVPSVLMGILLGMMRGMRASPGATFLDRSAENPSAGAWAAPDAGAETSAMAG